MSQQLYFPLTSLPNTQHVNVDDQSEHWQQLRNEIEGARLDYIWNDLEEYPALLSIIEMEYRLGRQEHAERTLDAVENCYSDMLRIFRQAKGLESGIEAEFQSKFKRVRERLDGLKKPK